MAKARDRRRKKYGIAGLPAAFAAVRAGGGEVTGSGLDGGVVSVHSVDALTPEGREALDAAAFLVDEWGFEYGRKAECS